MALLCCLRDADRSWKQEGRPCPPPTLHSPSSTFQWQNLSGSQLSGVWGKRSLQNPSSRITEYSGKGGAWS